MLERKSVNIQLNKDYKIVSDTNQWTLQERSLTSKKKEVWNNKYYYSTLSVLLQDVLSISQRGSGATSIDELIELTENIRLELKELLKPLEEAKVLF